MKRTSSLLLLGGVWIGAFVAAALAWSVHQPLSVAVPMPSIIAAATNDVAVATAPAVIEMKPVTITGTVAPVMVAKEKPLRCSDWRPLAMGPENARVKICEH